MASLDMVGLEIHRARSILDQTKQPLDSLSMYRALDSLWQVLYMMWLEAGGVVKSPQEQKSGQTMMVGASELAKMLKEDLELDKATSPAPKKKPKSDGYI